MKKLPRSIWIAGAVVLFIGFVGMCYSFQWSWTGFPTKSLWDWLNLLGVIAIPIIAGFGVAWYTTQQGKISDRENTENQREAALQTYIDKMSELLLVNNLRQSAEDDEVRKIARVRTLTVIRRLDPARKASLLRFLCEAGLIQKDNLIIDLEEVDLRGVNLSGVYLNGVNLSKVDLSGAILRVCRLEETDLFLTNLSGADLSGSVLCKARLRGANLSGANLSRAYMDEADLAGANLSHVNLTLAKVPKTNLFVADLRGAIGTTKEQLCEALTLKEATMPDGSKHP